MYETTSNDAEIYFIAWNDDESYCLERGDN